MHPIPHRPALRSVVALALLAGGGLMPTASAVTADTIVPPVTITAPIRPPPVATTPVESPVSYADDQADRGKKTFENECVDCHGDDLNGGLNGGPPLRGVAFDEKFVNGNYASSLFQFMSTQMPPNAPGRYSASTYADLMAYVLKKNGFQPGAPLPSDVDALDNLTMQK